MRLSIVTTLYRSAPYLEEFCQRAQQAAQKITPDYEIILVNDGSPDDSLAQAIKLHERHPRISVIDLSRNFGHHRALMAGLTQAQGEKVFLIDSDLEEEPEWLETFNTAMTEGIDVVYGVQNHRKGAWFERVSGAIFYRLFNWLAEVPIPTNAVTARLMTRQYVKSLLLHH